MARVFSLMAVLDKKPSGEYSERLLPGSENLEARLQSHRAEGRRCEDQPCIAMKSPVIKASYQPRDCESALFSMSHGKLLARQGATSEPSHTQESKSRIVK